jgi:hypothetical protein
MDEEVSETQIETEFLEKDVQKLPDTKIVLDKNGTGKVQIKETGEVRSQKKRTSLIRETIQYGKVSPP